ncbi:MAG TPA: hypothetical protein VG425_18440 [Casimicrobiaceae bacterium]|jgi:hypothetical protein|nr:hypothetical protein [Casimicrobiaceae bacterium]
MRPPATPARLGLGGSGGGRVTPEDVVDDGSRHLLYVADPGNAVEITTYDHRAVERALKC